jgi:flagellum-specific peptidoglycan hydrolase FlgJ
MNKSNVLLAAVALILSAILIAASEPQTPQTMYITKYASTAVREMYRSGVPASISLAQGLLESRAGQAPLATQGNNHFGIKCHNWDGGKMYQDDDQANECFRVYPSAYDSFKDHSDFLRYNDRYKFLFDNQTTDYKSWAYGLKQAGYATDPAYPSKLIKIIEDYHLSDYDKMTVEQADEISGTEALSSEEAPSEIQQTTATKNGHKIHIRKHKRNKKEIADNHTADNRIPESPLSIEAPKALDKSQMEEFRFSLSRQMYSKNGVPFVYAEDGETYASIARDNHLFLKELLKFNDLKSSRSLLPGTIVYLQAKKSQAAKGLDKYIVGSDEQTLWEICQRFGVKMSSVIKMNNFTSDYVPKEGDTIILRGESFTSRLFHRKDKNISYD